MQQESSQELVDGQRHQTLLAQPWIEGILIADSQDFVAASILDIRENDIDQLVLRFVPDAQL